jgi:hypothetical protein
MQLVSSSSQNLRGNRRWAGRASVASTFIKARELSIGFSGLRRRAVFRWAILKILATGAAQSRNSLICFIFCDAARAAVSHAVFRPYRVIATSLGRIDPFFEKSDGRLVDGFREWLYKDGPEISADNARYSLGSLTLALSSPSSFITICRSFQVSFFWRGSRNRNAGW